MTTTRPAEWLPDSPELVDVRHEDQLDWARLEEHLRSALPALRGAFSVEQFPHGATHRNFRLMVGPTRLVLRCARTVDADLAAEHRLLGSLSDAYARAPHAIHLCENTDVVGAPFLVMQYRPGFVIRDRLANAMLRLTDVGERLSVAVIDALVDLHRVDSSVVSPRSTELAVVHGDLSLDNCQFDEENPDVVTGVLDWEHAHLGDPLDDLRVLLTRWPGTPGGRDELAGLGFLTPAKVVELYAARTGLDLNPANFVS